MEFVVLYTLDAVGYHKGYEAGSKEQAVVKCVDELKSIYPGSVFEILGVEIKEGVEDEVKEEEKEEVVEKKKTIKKKKEV